MEMELLSRCNVIIGSAASSFSAVTAARSRNSFVDKVLERTSKRRAKGRRTEGRRSEGLRKKGRAKGWGNGGWR